MLGVGDNVDPGQLLTLAGDEDDVFFLDSYSDLHDKDLHELIVSRLCHGMCMPMFTSLLNDG